MKKVAISLSLILFGSLLFAQTQENELDQYISTAVENFELPALTISIVKDGEVSFQNSYGVKSREGAESVDTKSVFAIASLSKAFTAASIGILVDEGKLNWSDKVDEYIPSFRLSDEYVASQLTIEDLLCHRSGFNTFDGDLLWYGTNYSREEIIDRFKNYKMSYDFRTTYGYQNIMFLIAGEVVEEVSGMSWEDFVSERILKPLEMKNTYTDFEGFKNEENKALPHTKRGLDEIRSYDNSGGAAAMSSNVEDLSNWIKMWLNQGIYKEDTLFSKATYKKLLEMHTPIPTSNFDAGNGTEFKGYALGWFVMNYGDAKVAHHGGGLPGYISKLFLVPSKGIGGIILTNGETSLPTALMYHTMDHYGIRTADRNWAETFLGYSKRYKAYLASKDEERVQMRGKEKANIPMEDLIGEYEDMVYGKAMVEKKDGKLHFRMLPAEEIFSSELEHWQQNTYRIQFKDKFLPQGFVTFNVDANGKVIDLKVDLPNPDFHFYNLDFKKL